MFASLPPIPPSVRAFARAAVAIVGLALAADPARADSPGLDALEQFDAGAKPRTAVENRFFLKEGRFEIAPMIGYVPNNPYARRYSGGVQLGYHFSETVSAQAQILYMPDFGENDVKGLVSILLEKAYTANTADDSAFQQPLDKVGLGADFGVAWAPFYGKINLVGETVLNMDVYFFGGLGMVSKKDYIATYDEAGAQTTGDPLLLTAGANEVKVAPYIGIGQNYFLNRFVAFKIDVRGAFYVDNRPQYDPDVPVTEQRLYNNVIASGGIALFIPNMKPRLYEF